VGGNNIVNKGRKISLILFILGIFIALIRAETIFHGNVFGKSNSGIAIVIGIISTGLIATSNLDCSNNIFYHQSSS